MPIARAALVVTVMTTILSACSVGPAPRHTALPGDASGTRRPSADTEIYDAAVAALKAREYERARDILLQLSESSPADTATLTNLGIAQARLGNRNAAISALRRATAAHAGNSIAWNWLGQQLRLDGDLAASERAYQSALRIKPNDAPTHRNLAILYDLYLDRPAAALEHYQHYQRLDADAGLIVEAWIRSAEQRIVQLTLAENQP